MLPIKVENGVASINVNKTRKLTPRQLATLKHLENFCSLDDYNNYLNSLLGLNKRHVHIQRIKTHGHDKLASKQSNSILTEFKKLLQCYDTVDHRPSQRNVGEWVGVEIECYIPMDRARCTDDCDHDNGICEAEFTANDEATHESLRNKIRAAKIPRVSVKSDGSLENDEGIGVEVTILFNTADGFEPLNKLCRVLNEADCFVNDSCGLHVHLDCRHLKPKGVKLIGRRLGRTLPVLTWLVDKSRHNNNYCKLEVSKFTDNREYRYCAINQVAYFEFKTLEIRLHGGSTNHKKIRHWIELIRFLASKPIPKTFNTFQQLIDLGTPEHLVEYADKRINRLNPEAWHVLIPPDPVPVPVITPTEQVA